MSVPQKRKKISIKKSERELVLKYKGYFDNLNPIARRATLRVSEGKIFYGVFSGQYEGILPDVGFVDYAPQNPNYNTAQNIQYHGVFKDFFPSGGLYRLIYKDVDGSKRILVEYSGEMKDFQPNGKGFVQVYKYAANTSHVKHQLGEYKGDILDGRIKSAMIPLVVKDPNEIISKVKYYFEIYDVGKYYGEYSNDGLYKGFCPHGRGLVVLNKNYKPGARWFIGNVKNGELGNGEFRTI